MFTKFLPQIKLSSDFIHHSDLCPLIILTRNKTSKKKPNKPKPDPKGAVFNIFIFFKTSSYMLKGNVALLLGEH